MLNNLFFSLLSSGALVSPLLFAIACPCFADQTLSTPAPSNPSGQTELQLPKTDNSLVTWGLSDTLHTFDASVKVPPMPNLGDESKTPFYLAQFNDPLPNTPDSSAGQAPSLQTEPTSPNQKPFTPTQIKLKDPSAYVGRSSPAVTIITPSAYGQSFRSIGIGVGFQARTRLSNKSDGSYGIGFGLGDPKKAVGLSLGFISFSTLRRDFLEVGAINFKVNRYLPHDIAIAAGVNNGLTWGATDSSVSPYGVVTKQVILRPNVSSPLSRLYISAGVGGGQFRSESNVLNHQDAIGVFGSLALRVAEPVTFISEWSGQDLTLGLSVAPSRRFPIVFSPAVTDITGSAGDGPRFILGFGYGFRY